MFLWKKKIPDRWVYKIDYLSCGEISAEEILKEKGESTPLLLNKRNIKKCRESSDLAIYTKIM